ncbi:uncharacterized protein LOC121250939 [Juglans microcarpa x Juglans regia]|uniref:uncharacterized protein LOC121250939 n=1 Tax=Juglans microcarpa x Juglans regia TaxID=2249226 RepID=UPI001B7F6C61|nr:uncharacterized protein LOC121250939 [Juglans microcarpa x Juglans regia]
MASTSTETDSSSRHWKYDVFLSFHGKDTRRGFTSHLYDALKQEGIIAFRDDEKLKRGEFINSGLLKAIEESKYAVVVLSQNYASSRWCLIELAKIVQCSNDMDLVILPVFYHVDPSQVRKQAGTFAIPFFKHTIDPRIAIKDVRSWKAAFRQVGEIAGWHLHDGHDSTVVKNIIERIHGERNIHLQTDPYDLVGIESRVMDMVNLLDIGLDDVRFIGISGMGGIGKTTLAQIIYNRFSYQFEASSFISCVREETERHGLVYLQRKLLSDILMEREIINTWDDGRVINEMESRLCKRRVFLILDDVNENKQLEALAGRCEWFGRGSRVVVTSREKQVLNSHGVCNIYPVRQLYHDEALQLFSWKAFKKPHPEENFLGLSEDFVNYANGLPLALKVLGSSLFNKKKGIWTSARDQLKENLNGDILKTLKTGFDALKPAERNLFLDVACFFRGWDKDRVKTILKSCGYCSDINIDVLVDKSLMSFSGNNLWMHDLLQEMGQEIVCDESREEPGRRSRLWVWKDVLHVLNKNTGTEQVKGIVLDFPPQRDQEHLNADAFSKMKNLRFLKISNVHFPQGIDYLSNELRLIIWDGYPLKSLPTSFQSEDLIRLSMHCSCIEQLWKGIRVFVLSQNFENLRVIDLCDSPNLIETPDFHGVPNLETLFLRGCASLLKVHPSLGALKQLVTLNLEGCKCLESLPEKISMVSLKFCILSGCSKLEKFPEIVGSMTSLMKLNLSGTAIEELPPSFESLSGLQFLSLIGCKSISILPRVIFSLSSLGSLILSGCSELDKMPEDLRSMECLKELDTNVTSIRQVPSSILHVKSLKRLYLNGCKGLGPKSWDLLFCCCICHLSSLLLLDLGDCNLSDGAMPRDLRGLSSLETLNLRGNKFRSIPYSVCHLSSLLFLDLSECDLSDGAIPSDLRALSSLQTLNLRGNKFTCIPNSICHLSSLQLLDLSDCNLSDGAIPSDLRGLSSIGRLDLSRNKFRSIPDSISHLSSLTMLDLSDCNLSNEAIPSDLSGLSSLLSLDLSGNNFSSIADRIWQLSHLEELFLRNCSMLQSLPTLPSSLSYVWTHGCTSLERCFDETSDAAGAIVDYSAPAEHEVKRYRSFQKMTEAQFGRTLEAEMYKGMGSVFVRYYSLLIPEIPEWFAVQRAESSARILLHLESDDNCKWSVYAMFIVYEVREHENSNSRTSNLKEGHQVLCHFLTDEGRLQNLQLPEQLHLYNVRVVKLIGILVYVPRAWFSKVANNVDKWSFIEASVTTSRPGGNVKKFGVRLLNEQEVSELVEELRAESGVDLIILLKSDLQELLSKRFAQDEHFFGLFVKVACFWGTLAWQGGGSQMRKMMLDIAMTENFPPAPMNTQRVSSSSSSPPERRRKYDVFLSFRGEDTRLRFTDHLYDALKRKGIMAFRDDEELERGEYISSGLLKAIEESEYAVVVLSPNFASSRWCLIELAKIVRCRKDMELVVLPVFYHVDPSHVRQQSNTFAEALAKHEQNSSIVKEDVQTWRAALREVGETSGWHIQLQEGHESLFVKQIVASIYSKRNIQRHSIVSHDIVGIEFREMEMMNLLDIKLDDVRFIGFYGMDGVGKTTLAEFIYDKIFHQFEACSFIYGVSKETQSHDVVYLQRKILSEILMEREIINGWDDRTVYNEIRDRLRRLKVLIILDDVNENKQLEALAGSHEWFGRGSRVIVTSKEKQVLNSHGVHIIYTVKELGDDEALQLFCQKAFKKPHPEDNYADLSKDFVNYAKGLPGTLKVLGTFLFGKTIDEWKRVWDQLKENPDRGVLEMHDLLRKMDQERVLHESKEEPDQYSRLWVFEDVLLVPKNNTGAGEVRHIVLDIPPQQEEHLRFVWIGIFKENVFFAPVLETPDLRVIVQKISSHKGGDEYAIKQLKQLLRQIGGPVSLILDDDVFLSGSESLLEKFELRMPNCNILVTSGSKSSRYSFTYNLNSLNDEGAMTLCCHSATPQDGSSLSPDEKIVKKEWPAWLCESIHLKKLGINNCHKLSALPIEIGNLINLEELRLMSCTVLSKLPDTIGMLHRLHILDISDCPALLNLPNTIGRLLGLHTLRISDCANFSSLPDTVGMLSGLRFLEISHCTSLSNLPVTIGELRELQILHISHCSALTSLPDTIGMLLGLRILCISGCTVFSNLPETIGLLRGLRILGISGCRSMSDLPDTIGMLQGLSILGVSHCSTLLNLPKTIGMLEGLRILGISHCCALSDLPETIGRLHGLSIIGVSHCSALLNLPKTIGNLLGLRILGISHCPLFSNLPDEIGNLSGLRILGISYCRALLDLPETIGMLSGLWILGISHCPAFSNFPGTIRRLQGLQILDISHCPVLSNLPETIGMLREFRISDIPLNH